VERKDERVTSTNLDRIDDLIARQRRRGVDIRPTLLLTLTDVYVGASEPHPDDEARYVEIALRLIGEVDAETRREVARKLVDCPRVPSAFAERLAELARPPRAASPTPVAAAKPADRGDAVLARRFLAADSAERRRILSEIDVTEAPPPPADAPRAVAALERSALAGHPGEFIRSLEGVLDLPRETAERIVNDLSGEPMVVVARALGMPLAVLQRILMFLNPAIGHSVRRVYDLSDLYEQVSPAAARGLAAAWSPVPAAGRFAPRPMRRYRDDGSLRATTARPLVRQPVADRKAQRTT
jgi:hypothetical protein